MRTDATSVNQCGGVLSRNEVFIGDQRVSARAVGAELHLVVLEVGLLGDHGDAVRECPLHGVDRFELFFCDDAAGCGDDGQQRDIVEVIRVGLDHQRVRAVELCLQRRSQGPVFAGLDPLGTKHQEHRVVRLRPGSRQLIDLGQGDLWQ